MSVSQTDSDKTVLLAERIKHYLGYGNTAALRRLLIRANFADIAEVMENMLSTEEMVTCFQLLNIGQAAQVLTSLSEERQIACLSSLPTMLGSKIIRTMAADDAVDILQELDTEQTRKILDQLPFDTDTKVLQHLLLEEPDTAAGIMSTDFIKTSIEGTVGDALKLIRRADAKDFVYYCYLVDNDDVLVGVVALKKLITHDESVPLSRIATFDTKSILVSYDQELVANLFRKYYNLLAMPVVDADNILRGIITIDDIVDIIDEESREDIYRASGINLEEIDEKNLLTGPVYKAVKARFPWLTVTLLGQFFASTIIAHHKATVAGAVIAVSFMPMLTGLTGNMGTQSETIAVRGISLSMITRENVKEKLLREGKVGLLTGTIFAVCVGAFSFLLYRHLLLSLLLTTWITISMTISAGLGIFIPFVYQHYFKRDPAGVSGPFITTFSDICTFTIYLSILAALIHEMI